MSAKEKLLKMLARDKKADVHKPNPNRQKIMDMFGQVLDEAMSLSNPPKPEEERREPPKGQDQEGGQEVTAILASIMERLKKIEGALGLKREDAGDQEGGEGPTLEEEGAELREKLDIMAETIAELVATEGSDDEEKEVEIKPMEDGWGGKVRTSDSATLAAAEILAPGIKDGPEIKSRALKTAWKTVDGRRVIASIIGNQEPAKLSASELEIVFAAASQALKGVRRQHRDESLSLMQQTRDSLSRAPKTAAEINKANAAFYAKKA